MDHYGPANNVLNRKAVRPHSQIGTAPAQQQGWKIPRMAGMRRSSGVIVAARTGEIFPGAAPSLMNVQREESRAGVLREAGYIGYY